MKITELVAGIVAPVEDESKPNTELSPAVCVWVLAVIDSKETLDSTKLAVTAAV